VKKIIVVFFILSSASAFSQSNNREWFKKVQGHLSFGTHVGKLISRCAVNISPTDSDTSEIIATVEKTRINENETLASIHLMQTDRLTGSSKYPSGPYETRDVLSFGYQEKSSQGFINKALIIESRGSKRVAVTIESFQNGKLTSKTCVVEKNNKHY
jgi:hypothetical protein